MRFVAGASCLLALLSGGAGCGGSAKPSAAAGSDAAEEPASAGTTVDLERLLGRESQGLGEVAVTGPNRAWSAKVGASGPAEVSIVDKLTVVEIPIGAEAKARCQVFNDDIDTGGTLGEILGGASQKVELKRVAPRGIRMANDAPIAFVNALYTANSAKGKAAGELKIAVHPAAGHPVVCLHDELGYEKTFEKLVTEFCESLKFAGKGQDKPEYLEVQIASIGDLAVGFERRHLVKEQGVRKLQVQSSLFIPRGPSELHLVDSYTIETIDTDGLLKAGAWVEAAGGKLEVNVRAERQKGGAYTYEGEVRGKPVKGALKTKSGKGIPTALSLAERLARESKKPKGFSVEDESYLPGADPSAVTTVKYSRQPADPAGTVHVEMGPIKLLGQLDALGLFERLDAPVGQATLRMQRELIRGEAVARVPGTTIVGVSVEPWDIALTEPFGIATGAQTVAANALVRVLLDDGTEGLGEAAPFPAVNGETQAAAIAALHRARDALVGMDAARFRHVVAALRECTGTVPSALAALESAVLDAITRRAGMSLWAFFGGAEASLETDVTIVTGTPDDAAAAASRAALRGFRTLKVKVGGAATDHDAARLVAIVAAAPAARLVLDANASLTADEAIELVERVGAERVALFEQPTAQDDLAGMHAVRRRTRVLVAADESARSAADVAEIAQARAADVINVKITKSGIAEACDMIAAARGYRLGLMVGGMVESPLAMSVSACLAAGHGGFEFVDLDTPFFMKNAAVQAEMASQGPDWGPLLPVSRIALGHGVRVLLA